MLRTWWNSWTEGNCKTSRNQRPFRPALEVEWLEERTTPSTIAWLNRGQPTDGFAAAFGPNANLARQIVDRAINNWQTVIQNFNYAGGGNTYNLTLFVTNLGPGVKGATF